MTFQKRVRTSFEKAGAKTGKTFLGWDPTQPASHILPEKGCNTVEAEGSP